MDEAYVEECTVLAAIHKTYKSLPVTNGTIRFCFTRLLAPQAQPEPMIVSEGKEYLVFLAQQEGESRFPSDTEMHPAYKLADRWLGAIEYSDILDWAMTRQEKK